MAGGKIKGRKNIVDELSSRITELMAQVLSPGGDGITQFFFLQFFFPSFISRSFVHSSCKDLEDRSVSFGITYPAIFFFTYTAIYLKKGLNMIQSNKP